MVGTNHLQEHARSGAWSIRLRTTRRSRLRTVGSLRPVKRGYKLRKSCFLWQERCNMEDGEASDMLVSVILPFYNVYPSSAQAQPTNPYLPQGRLHHLRRLHHLSPRRSRRPLRRSMRLLPRLEVLPRAGQVRDPDA